MSLFLALCKNRGLETRTFRDSFLAERIGIVDNEIKQGVGEHGIFIFCIILSDF